MDFINKWSRRARGAAVRRGRAQSGAGVRPAAADAGDRGRHPDGAGRPANQRRLGRVVRRAAAARGTNLGSVYDNFGSILGSPYANKLCFPIKNKFP